MAIFKSKSPEEHAAKEARRAANKAAKERARYEGAPVGRADAAFTRGDLAFQYQHSVGEAAII